MRAKPGSTVLVVVLFFLAVLGVVAYYGQGSGTKTRTKTVTTKRFTAKPGTTRPKAVPLVSNKRAPQEKDKPPSPPIPHAGRKDEPLRVLSLSQPEAEERLTDEQRLIQNAMNTFSVEAGIAKLEDALKTPREPDAAAGIHAAMGLLESQKNPPNLIKLEEAFAKAMGLPTGPEVSQQVAGQYCQVLMRNGKFGAAREKLEGALAQDGPLNGDRLHLRVMLGQVYERDGDSSRAESAFRTVLDDASTLGGGDNKNAFGAIRLAGMRLSRLYRLANRNGEADALAKEVSNKLDSMEQEGEA